MPKLKFILRDINRTRGQAIIFLLCVALAFVTLVAVNGFSASIDSALSKDAQALHAADIIVHSRQELSSELVRKISRMETAGLIESARIHEFYSVVRTATGGRSLLSNIKAVAKGYPFYGRLELASGRSLAEVLRPGRIVVAPVLLERLELQTGDRLTIGQATLTIADVVLTEPDRPVDAFALGPRIFVSTEDLGRIDLIEKGSRVRYAVLIKVADPARLNRLADDLAAATDPVQERVDTYRTAPSGVKRFFDNFIFFLNLIGIFTLLLAGIGIYTTLSAYLKEKENTIAIMKAVGASGRFILAHFILGLLFISLIGTALGLVFGLVAQEIIPALLSGLIPPQVELSLSRAGILEGIVVGIVGVALFAYLPLYRLRGIKPADIFRKDGRRPSARFSFFLILLMIGALFTGLVLWQLQAISSGLIFIISVIGFISFTALLTQASLSTLRRLPVKSLMLRQAVKGLFRPRNATRPIIITLSVSLAVIFTIYGVETNLDRQFVQTYPPDAPNLFFLDIQPDQRADFERTLGIETRYYPIVRARILSVNGNLIDRNQERQRRRGDNLARTFNLTFRDDLLKDEIIEAGRSLFRSDWPEAQVSVLDTVVALHHLKIGDRIVFRIQGIDLEARISSIRSRTRESLTPFFYFVFQEDILKNAPQTIFTAVRVDKSRIAGIQSAIIEKFPNVSVIDMTETIKTFAAISRKLSGTIRFFTALGILAGLLITVGSVFATRLARTREAVYYQVLGARTRFVAGVFALENLILGGLSGLLALLISQLAAWIIIAKVFDIPFTPFAGAGILMTAAATLLVTATGLLPSCTMLRQKPVAFLREETHG
ncbi:MAG: FtsX-like permease family protein [Desulfobacterales bacterium]